jgi:hypothetical protein
LLLSEQESDPSIIPTKGIAVAARAIVSGTLEKEGRGEGLSFAMSARP